MRTNCKEEEIRRSNVGHTIKNEIFRLRSFKMGVNSVSERLMRLFNDCFKR